MMRLLGILLLSALPLLGQASDEQDVVATVQKTFDGMAGHNAAVLRSTMLPDAHLYSIRQEGAPGSTAIETWVTQVSTLKSELLERFTKPPRVLIRGRMAQVWGEYEFLRDGKFTHCGVDSFTLLKTSDGWKIATIAYTVETTGCQGH